MRAVFPYHARMQPAPAPMVPAPHAGLSASPFSHTKYTIIRPYFSLFGRTFRVYANGVQVLYVRHKVFSLKDRWSIFTDDSMTVPLISVGARQAFKIDMVTDVFDATTNQVIGTIRNKGWKSIVRDTWEILGPDESVVGHFQEDSNAFLRRIFPILLGKWHLEMHGREVARIAQVFRFFQKEFTLEIVPGAVDPRFALACSLLALMREIAREAS